MAWRALELAGVPVKYVPYQLRHGGPSHDRLKRYRSMAEIKARSRWASDYTMKRYEAHALVQQELAALPADVRRLAEAAPAKLHAELERVLARPHRATTATPSARLRAASESGSRRRAPTPKVPQPPLDPGPSSSSCAVLPLSPKQSTLPAGLQRAGTMPMIREPTFLMTPSSTVWF